MKYATLLIISLLPCLLQAQVPLALADNLDLSSNTSYQIDPGIYTLGDPGADGLLRINGAQNIIVDGAGVQVQGAGFGGHLIRIDQSENITLRNFASGSGFFYSIYISNSKNIRIENCNFSWNKVDSTGWISIWTDYDQALGGGALLVAVDSAKIAGNTMKFQNDGVALYNCTHIDVHDNDFSWNTSFGIRMNFTDSCLIARNNCSHVNRPYTDPSDCAALLMIVSNNNRVEHNDLSYSGDGVFLGQYEYSNVPNNNYFAYNECSYSPHNAIEATFADGNVYKHNICNYSHYGFWLGYSFNSVVDSNDVTGNQYAGIAIDRGFNNTITHNTIRNNPTGIDLWEGAPIAGYDAQGSHDYRIEDNLLEGNGTALSLDKSEKTKVLGNRVFFNQRGIYTANAVQQDTISGNIFRGTTGYHLEHTTVLSNIYAAGNQFVANDSALIERKIRDKKDVGGYGQVLWQPAVPGGAPQFQDNPHYDLAEPPAQWFAYPEACWGYGLHEATTVSWDSTLKKDGAASAHLRTGNGWDLALNYHPGGDSTARWNLTELDTLQMWFRTIRQVPYGFQFFHVRLGNDHGGWYEYMAPVSVLNNANLVWRAYAFPLSGNATWVRSAQGTVSLDDITYVEIHADTWEFGFDLWVDGLRFAYSATGTEEAQRAAAFMLFPNPARDEVILRGELPAPSLLGVDLFDWTGRAVYHEDWGFLPSGSWQQRINLSGLASGTYLCRIGAASRMLVVLPGG